MDEIKKFLWLLRKHRYTIIIIPVIAILITYYLVRNLPNSYVSQARISTGLVDDSRQAALLNAISPRGQEVVQEFSSIVEMMRMKKILDQVSYKLIIHDLTAKKPFRNPRTLFKEFNPEQINRALKVYNNKYLKTEELNLWNKEQERLYHILTTIEYDSESLLNDLRINRAGDSDFINVEFRSENPELSAFVANTLSSEFIKYYTVLRKANQRKATTFLRKLVDEKKQGLDKSVDSLRNYKIRNRVLNLDEQSSQLYAQILEYNNRRQEVIKSIASNTGALNEIDRKFEPGERRYLESALTRLNQRIIGVRQELQALYDQYIESNFDEQYKMSIDSLQSILTAQINSTNDTYAYNPLNSKEELVRQKLNLEIQLDLARYSMHSIETELNDLNRQFDQLVPHEALVQSLERAVQGASQEYLDVLSKFNQSSLESGLSEKLNLVQSAMPGAAEPSKKMLLVILSGIISFVFCLVVLFVLFFIDNSISSAKELANKTQLPVLGQLKMMNGENVNLKKIWSDLPVNSEGHYFKESLRSVRFEMESALKGKILSISSLRGSEGKTLLAISIAYAFKMTGKRVLLIDGNFRNPDISRSAEPEVFLEDYFKGAPDSVITRLDPSVTIMANRGGDKSVLEIADASRIKNKFDQLKDSFDIIIIETPSLYYNEAKEWINFSDDVVLVYEAGKSITESNTSYIQYLKGLNGKLAGWIFNKAGRDNEVTADKRKAKNV
ncbi:exopolysaccharide transport family protein [Arcticibacter tournemirensis]|uniref:Lipopolysaccharide biosynthesis protein n=1 Tax=Arcticibacter tournemirensis TaxID=699437 RepID=A0A4V1KIX6_9SPHI|nr:lipopolysaccharide biosynthesis protein [Arcticibacter tournemirensis]RXF72222.1 lipopolysaccharide biosynthesis protein [Arcticibacter tournemirensis]